MVNDTITERRLKFHWASMLVRVPDLVLGVTVLRAGCRLLERMQH